MVSPDLGNAKVATQFARLLGLPVAAGSKQRISDDRVVIDSIVGDVHGRRAIVLDDEIATGGSMLELMDRLKDAGSTEASIVCTHGLFAGKAVERLRDHPFVTEVVTTDTVPAAAGWPELKVRSVSGLFAEAISRDPPGESVSSLFEGVDPTHAPPQAEAALRRTVMSGAVAVLRRPPVAFALDVLLVLAFAGVGRASHDEANPLLGALLDRMALPRRHRCRVGRRAPAAQGVALEVGRASRSGSPPSSSGWSCGSPPGRARRQLCARRGRRARRSSSSAGARS